MGISHSRPIVENMLKDGILVRINGEMANGEPAELIIHRDNLPCWNRPRMGPCRPGAPPS